ncbi:hypothetical protein [Streptomyces sp. NPDC090056]|uniref:hypothetical protein n=1 Tax=Streptomyces sp. NPDC090056 TaxID=3365934 RepID=UPI0038149F71
MCLAAGERQIVAVLACGRTELRLAAFDPAGGGLRWTASLGGRTAPAPDGQVALLSAEPPVVQNGGTTEGGQGAFLLFGEGGKAPAGSRPPADTEPSRRMRRPS